MTFEGKRQVFKTLAEKYEKEFVLNNPKIFNEISSILTERNIFAHYQLDTGTKAADTYISEDAITFIKYKTAIDWIKYTKQDVQRVIDLIFDCIEKIDELNNSKRIKP